MNEPNIRSEFGNFNKGLRNFSWSVDEFVEQVLEQIRRNDGAVVAECQVAPAFTAIATDHMPSWVSWINAFEYDFRIVWRSPLGDRHHLRQRASEPGTDAWQTAKDLGCTMKYYDVKTEPRWKVVLVYDEAYETDPSIFDSGSRGVAARQAAM